MFKEKLKLFLIIPIIIPIVCAVAVYFQNEKILSLFLHEDKILETVSVFVWLGLGIIFALYAIRLSSKPFVCAIYVICMILSIFVMMEEISWGQRIFNIETPKFFLENNAQQETNLHNLKIGETKINRIVLQRIAPLFLLAYFIILPILYSKKVNFAHKFVKYFELPLLPIKYLWTLLLYTLITFTLVNHDRQGELTEFYIPYVILLLFVEGYYRLKNNYDENL